MWIRAVEKAVENFSVLDEIRGWEAAQGIEPFALSPMCLGLSGALFFEARQRQRGGFTFLVP